MKHRQPSTGRNSLNSNFCEKKNALDIMCCDDKVDERKKPKCNHSRDPCLGNPTDNLNFVSFGNISCE